MYRTDFITAMKIPDQHVLDEHFIRISDPWKQEYDKGVQVPVDIESLPQPDFKKLDSSEKTSRIWNLPEKYYKWQPEVDIINEVMDGKVPEPIYDMDEDDCSFLHSINSVEDPKNKITELDFEVIMTYLDAVCHVNMYTKYQDNLTYSIQYDDSVYCEVCKDIYSEPDNEMIFCDNCNICVHQSCYGVSKIPQGEWYCSPCKADCSAPVCLLCMQGEGAFKQAKQGEWVHVFCALWIPEVGFGNVEKMEPITKIKQIPISRWSLSCCFCQERVGACIQCSMKNCFVPFHPSCAYSNRCHMMTIYGTPEEPEIVENFAYCIKHSSEKFREPSTMNTIVLPQCRKDQLNPLYNNQKKIARTLLNDFDEFVDVLDVSTTLDINVSTIQFTFDYWKEKRKLNGNNPLIKLPPLSELVEKCSKLKNQPDCSELDPFLKLVSLRQDLERARVLVHMSERRERLKKRWMNSIFSVIECCFKEGSQLPQPLFSLSRGLPKPSSRSNSDVTSSSDNDSELNISQSSISKVFLSPVINRDHLDVFDFKDNEHSLVAHEVILRDDGNSDQSDSKKPDLAYDYRSSEDPEWVDAPKRPRKKKHESPSKLNKMKLLASQFSRKITIELSDKSDVQSSVDDSCHFSTPPTSPEFSTAQTFGFPKKGSDSQISCKRRRNLSHSSDDNGSETYVLANTPPSPKNNKENIKSLNASKTEDVPVKSSPVRSRRVSKRHKPNESISLSDCHFNQTPNLTSNSTNFLQPCLASRSSCDEMNIVEKLEDLENQVWSSDLYVRQEASSELLTVLSEATDEVFDGRSFQWDSMCGGLVRWISGTNFKISLVALKAISMIATRMGEDLAPICHTMLPAIIDRLGDTKDTVRKEAASLIQVLMSYVKTPKTILEELLPRVMEHKNAKVREGMLLCISETLLNFGHKELSISKMIPSVLELASDSSAPVRDQAVETLCDIYRLVGEPIRNDILRRRSLPFQKEKLIISRFDDLLAAGMVSADSLSERILSDESLNSEPEKVKTIERGGGKISKSTSSGTLNKRAMPLKKSASSHKSKGGLAGADSELLTEDNLDTYIQDYNTVDISSPKELTDFCNNCADILENTDDWEKRVAALRDLRGMMFCGVDHFKGFKLTITGMSRAIEKAVKDLRSQVVREACVTVACMSTEMGNDFGSLGEKLLVALFSQLLVNVKIMNYSAHVCLRRIISCTQYSKMLLIICEQVLKSKSAMCRKRAAEYIELIFQIWDLNLITKNLTLLESSIKSGINDADSDTRVFSRKTFWLFNEHFPKNAENMMKTFDTSKKKMLLETKMGKSSAPGAGSSSTLKRNKKLAPGSSATLPKKPTMSKSTPDLSQLGKTSTLPRQPKTPARVQGAPRSTTASPANDRTSIPRLYVSPRGARAEHKSTSSYGTSNIPTRTGVIKSKSTVLSPSLARDTAAGVKKSKSGVMRSKDAAGGGGGQSSQSRQTAARSGSSSGGVRRSVSARSVNSLVSNETRSATLRRANNRASPGRASPASTSSASRTAQQAQPRTPSIRKSASANLNQDSLASAFGRGTIPRMTSQDSIASSTDSSSHDVDIQEIVRASESSSWKIREEGVHKLKTRINEERGFNTRERRIVLQLFENLLNDNHAKILGTTLDVLDEFLALYRTNLTDWGATILAKALYLQSMKQTQSNFDRVMRLLDTLHRSFPYDLQLTWCFSILDSRQVNSNAKMKGTLLEYMSCTFEVMDPMEFIQTKESTIGLKVLLQSSTDPKAPDIRKKSATLIATMFRHSPPVFSSILNTVTEAEQGQCVMLLQETVPNMMSQESEVLMGYPGYNKIVSDRQSATSEESASLFDAINQRFGSSPGSYTYDVDAENINPDALSSPVSKMSINKNRENSFSEQRDRSLTTELQAVSNLNNTNGGSEALPHLQSPSLNGSMPETNAVFSVLEALLGGSQEEKSGALIESLNLLKEDTSINEENSYDLLSAIMSCTEEDDTELVSKALKVLNKFLVYQAQYMAPHCEEVVTKIVRAKCPMQHADSESLYQLLVMVYKTEAILNLIVPMLQHETYPVLLSVINLLYSTLKQNTPESQPMLESRLPALASAVCPQCSHVETNVRKQSIFCLVELLLIFGTEKVDALLEGLTVSQKKLVYLYYNRHQRNVR
ncbi:hypothetical protein ACHWQZ_G012456 [Mnemiopsis leidyi]